MKSVEAINVAKTVFNACASALIGLTYVLGESIAIVRVWLPLFSKRITSYLDSSKAHLIFIMFVLNISLMLRQ